MKTQLPWCVVLLASALPLGSVSWAQTPPPANTTPSSARQSAPIDLTGYWVSIVTEDWRWRMLTPPRGNYASVPLSNMGKQIADTFDPSRYAPGQIDCRAYGAGGLMRMPTRAHITWATADTLKIETDWGEQTRLLHFAAGEPPGAEPTLQGHSTATWHGPSR
jgi:hypothetical protein